MKLVTISKIGSITKVQETLTENPNEKKTHYMRSATLKIEGEEALVMGTDIRFSCQNVGDNYGKQTIEELVDELALRNYF